MSGKFLGLLGLFALTSVGCQNALQDENMQLRRQNIELQQSKTTLENELRGRPQQQDVQVLQGQLAERDRQISELQNKINEPTPGEPAPTKDFGDITVTRDDKAGTITVNIPGDVLFASGDAAVKPAAKGTLSKIAGIIKSDFKGKKVFVEGHSDSDPISRTKDKWKDNLDLSAARARSVADYLAEQGVDKKSLGTRAMGETEPLKSAEKSRRVEIVVVTR